MIWGLKVVEITSGRPYTDTDNIRVFNVSKDQSEFVWHRDKEDRIIEVIEGDGWQFQPENCLPLLLEPGIRFNIEKGEYHRLIKGVNNLKVKITKII